jgi:hypothetical protein
MAEIEYQQQKRPGILSLTQVETILGVHNCEMFFFDDKYKSHL